MRLLKIDLFDEDYRKFQTIMAEHLDATSQLTFISSSQSWYESKKLCRSLHLPFELDHWNIMDGLVTIYYKCGCLMEISRLKSSG